jgi:hypothetical protein
VQPISAVAAALPLSGRLVVVAALALLALLLQPDRAASTDTPACSSGGSVPTPTVVTSVTSVVYRLEPARGDLRVGQTCTIDLRVDVASSSLYIDELRVYLSFPADTLEITDAQGRPAVEVLTTAFGTVTRNQVENQTGRIDLVIGPGSVGRRGSFVVARLYVRGRGETGSAYQPLAFDRDGAGGRATTALRLGTPVPSIMQDGSYRLVGPPRLAGRVQFQAGPAAAGPIGVEFAQLGASPVATAIVQPSPDGSFTVAAPGAGVYDVRVRAVRTGVSAALPVRAPGVTIPAEGAAQVEFGCLREGDADGDGDVDSSGATGGDAGVLVQSFDQRVGVPGARADFDRSGAVTIVDFSLLAASYGMAEQTAPASCD